LYNGKDLQGELGLEWLDYGARYLDPVIGRWNCIDPASQEYSDWNTYQYVRNNPVARIDPNGWWDDWYQGYYEDGTSEMKYFPAISTGFFLTGSTLWINRGDGINTIPMGRTDDGYLFMGYKNGDYGLSLPEATITGNRPKNDISATIAFCDLFANTLWELPIFASTLGVGSEIFAGAKGLSLFKETLIRGTINSGYDIANDLWYNEGRLNNVDIANVGFNYIPYGAFGENTGRLIGAIASPILKSTVDYRWQNGLSTSLGLGNQKDGARTALELFTRTFSSSINYNFRIPNNTPLGVGYNIFDRSLRSQILSFMP
jgi:RHS repeat-associated protein